MKIAMIGQKGVPGIFGGVERHVEQLSLILTERGHDVTVYTRPYYTPAKRTRFHKVRLVSLPSLRTKHFDAISHTFLATLHAVRQDSDIIHYHGVGPALLAFLPRLFRHRAKVIVTFHCIDRKHQKWGSIARFFLWLGERAAVFFPHETIVVSKTLRAYCRQNFRRNVTYIPNGVPLESTRTLNADAIRKKFGLIANQYILAVSRLIPHKGIHHLIKAYQQLATEKPLVIVGDSFYTDAYVKDLKKLAGSDPRIIFTGFQKGKTLKELFSNAYLFVLPSESEGLPITLLEAASFGKCVLASNIPENIEVIRSGKQVIGYTFKNRDTDDLRRMLEQLMHHQKTIQSKGQLAKTVVRKRFNWIAIVLDVERVYSSTY